METMEKKQQVAAFAWEPAGDRFALVLGDVPKLEVTFYTMKVNACLSCGFAVFDSLHAYYPDVALRATPPSLTHSPVSSLCREGWARTNFKS